jgi:hypothetical protein
MHGRHVYVMADGKIAPETAPKLPDAWKSDNHAKDVEMVPISFLQQIREWDRRAEPRNSHEEFEALKNDIAVHGIRHPLIINYDPKTGHALLGEGNHRLAILEELGQTHAPARVGRSGTIGDNPRARKLSGAVRVTNSHVGAELKPSDVFYDYDHIIPSDPYTRDADIPAAIEPEHIADEQIDAIRGERAAERSYAGSTEVDDILDALFGKSMTPQDQTEEPDAPHVAGRHDQVLGATEANTGEYDWVAVEKGRVLLKADGELKIADDAVCELIRSKRWGLQLLDVSSDRFRPLGWMVGRGADLGRKGECLRLFIWPKRTPEMEIKETVANAEFAKDTIWYDSRIANVRIDGIRLKAHNSYSTKVPSVDGLIWRGICYEDMQSIREHGYAQTKGEYNFDTQGVLTYFAERLDVAADYAGNAAPYQRMPTFERYSYVIGIKRPDPSRIDEANSPPGEVAVRGKISSSEIVAVYEVRPFAIWAGHVDLVRTYDGMTDGFSYRQGERKSPKLLLAYRKMTTKEVGSLHSDIEKSITDDMAKKYPGGHWVTTNGRHVYIKADGKVAPETMYLSAAGMEQERKKAEEKASKAAKNTEEPKPKGSRHEPGDRVAFKDAPDKPYTVVAAKKQRGFLGSGTTYTLKDDDGNEHFVPFAKKLVRYKGPEKKPTEPAKPVKGSKKPATKAAEPIKPSTKSKKTAEKPTETTSQPVKGAKKAPAKAKAVEEPAKPQKAAPKGAKKPPAGKVAVTGVGVAEVQKLIEKTPKAVKPGVNRHPSAKKEEPKAAEPAKKPAKSRLERLAKRRGETVDTVGTEKPKIDERGRRKKAEFQDVGQKVGGARKDVAAQFLDSRSVDDLKELEQHDTTQAYEAIKRDNLWEKFDAQKEMDSGVSPGAAFLKKNIVASIAKSPQKLRYSRSGYKGEDDNSPAARENYLKATNLLQDLLSKAKTAQNVVDGIHDIIRQANQTVAGKMPEFKREDFPSYDAFVNARNAAYAEATKDRDALVDSLKSLGPTFYNRYMRGGDTWREHRITAKEHDAKNDWSWSEAKARSTGGEAKPVKPKWERQVPTVVVRKGGVKKPPATKAADFMKVFGMRGVEFGNWVNDDEAKYHVEQASLAFADFSDVTGIEMKDLSLNGRLAMAFGARGKGKASAHYERDKKVINMTKFNGGGSLAHEWAHALDNILSQTSHPDSAGVTDGMVTTGKIGPNMNPRVKDAIAEVKKAILKGDGKYTVDVDENTRPEKQYSVSNFLAGSGWNIDAAIAEVKRRYPGTKPKVLEDIGKGFVQQMRQNGYTPPKSFSVPTGVSQYVTTAGALGEYWSKSEELFARAFESFIEDKLVENGRYSSYLVSGTALGEGATTGLFGEPWPYPLGDERKTINAAMQKLVDAVRDTQTIKKSLAIMEERETREVFRHIVEVPKSTVERFFHVVDVENPDLVKGLKASDLTGGRWITIEGNHVYVKDGKIVAGPKALKDLSLKDAKAKTAGGSTKAANTPAKGKTGTTASKPTGGRGKKVSETDEKPVKTAKSTEKLPKSLNPGHADAFRAFTAKHEPGKAPWEMSKEEFAKNTPKGFKYVPDLKAWANATHDDRVEIGPKWFDEVGGSSKLRRRILAHELGHNLADRMNEDGTAFTLANTGAMGKLDKHKQLIDGFEGTYNPQEFVAESMAALMTDKEGTAKLKEKYPEAYAYIATRAVQDGWPVLPSVKKEFAGKPLPELKKPEKAKSKYPETEEGQQAQMLADVVEMLDDELENWPEDREVDKRASKVRMRDKYKSKLDEMEQKFEAAKKPAKPTEEPKKAEKKPMPDRFKDVDVKEQQSDVKERAKQKEASRKEPVKLDQHQEEQVLWGISHRQPDLLNAAQDLKELGKDTANEMLEQGYVHQYWSPNRPVLGMTNRGEGEVRGSRFLFTKEPLSLDRMADLSLVPVGKGDRSKFQTAGRAAVDFYRQKYGTDQTMIFYKDHGDGEWSGYAVTPSAKEPGKWQATKFDENGFSSDLARPTVEHAVGEVLAQGYNTPLEPGFLDQVGLEDKFGEGNAKTMK